MNWTYSEIRRKLLNGETDCEQIVRDYLRHIDCNRHLNAYITVFSEDKLKARCSVVQRNIHNNQAGALAGMVIAVKDAIMVKNERNTCGSRILENYVSPYDATVVQRLEAADAIIIGKANLDEFAMGSSNENSAFGPVKNPMDPERVPGGSSGGSAVCVAANMATASLGSETGGSVRLPASFCGIVGLKPTYGRVSRYGLAAFASSFDQIGPMANTVEDVAAVTHVMAGWDEKDSTTSKNPVPDYSESLTKGVRNLRIGIPREYFIDGMQPDVENAVKTTIEKLSKAGAEIVNVSLPHTEYGIATYYILTTAEASSNLARYDGIRYTRRSGKPASAAEAFVRSRSEGFGAEVKRRIMLGTYVLSAGYYDAYYRKAQKVRTLIKSDFDRVFQGPAKVDCILAPTSPTTAFKIGEKTDDPLAMYLSDVFTVNINIAGVPSLSVPCGKDAAGLPIGIQAIAGRFDEAMCFRVGRAIEQLNAD